MSVAGGPVLQVSSPPQSVHLPKAGASADASYAASPVRSNGYHLSMTSEGWDAQSELYKILGEDRGALLSKATIEIRQMEKGRTGYEPIMVETFTLDYGRPILFVEYEGGFYFLISHQNNSVNYQPLKTLKFENIKGAGHPRILIDLKGTKFFTNTSDTNGQPIVIYLDTGTFFNQAFMTEDDLYTAYAFVYHRDEFMRYMLDGNSTFRAPFLDVIKTEYHHGIRSK